MIDEPLSRYMLIKFRGFLDHNVILSENVLKFL